MEKNPLIPIAVEKYKQQLCDNPAVYNSFASFCRSEHLREKSVAQWMHRHGLSVGTLRAEAMLSVDPEHSVQWLEAYTNKVRATQTRCHTTSSSSKTPTLKQLRGVSIAFSDGLVVNIRQTTPSALVNFINSYNKLMDNANV